MKCCLSVENASSFHLAGKSLTGRRAAGRDVSLQLSYAKKVEKKVKQRSSAATKYIK